MYEIKKESLEYYGSVPSSTYCIEVSEPTSCVHKDHHDESSSNNQKSVLILPQAIPYNSRGRIALAIGVLVGVPLMFYQCIPEATIGGNIQALINAWDGLMHISVFPVAVMALFSGVFCRVVSCKASCCSAFCKSPWSSCQRAASTTTITTTHPQSRRKSVRKKKRSDILICSTLQTIAGTPDRVAILVSLFLLGGMAVISPFHMLVPAWHWNPFLFLSRYRVYYPTETKGALEGMCLPNNNNNNNNHELSPDDGSATTTTTTLPPLCLSKHSWNLLSSGALSSSNPTDVNAVREGIEYSLHQSGGIVVATTARDIVDQLGNFRQNVESLLPFFSNLSVVIFENDSDDGSREAIKTWAVEVNNNNNNNNYYYVVDLMDCPEMEDCRLGKIHRDEDTGDFAHSKAVGDMDRYRQRMADYILENPDYEHFSHMMVVDIDLGISLSPLGILHTLGVMPNNPVASSGRQSWPTALGTIIPPYDFSAFRPYVTQQNQWINALHDKFCQLMPEGDRWRNECDAMSSMRMIEVLTGDRGSSDLYRVESAFNGAVLYPLKLVRGSHAQYDAGSDGQRCEHIGFNLSLKKPMYVNRKWDLHVDPTNPGGPTGWRAKNTVVRVISNAKIQVVVLMVHFLSMVAFVHSILMLGVCIVYPILISYSRRIRHYAVVSPSSCASRVKKNSYCQLLLQSSRKESTLLKMV